jgi:signal transduction histidine kinase
MDEPAGAEAQCEWLLLRLLALIRAVALCQLGLAVTFDWHALSQPAAVAGIAALLAVESAIFIGMHWRRRGLDTHLPAVLDACLAMGALLATVGLLKWAANPDSDNVLYPYSVTSLAAIGLAYRRLRGPALAATAAAAVYLAATAWRFGTAPGMALVINATTYVAWAVASWFVGDRLRRLSAELDTARRVALERERDLERERERVRLSRVLHDRVLQTLEFVGRETWIPDARMRDHVAAEAVWLRELVSGGLDQSPAGLSAALEEVVTRQTAAGLRVELNISDLRADSLPEGVVQAIAGAVDELLTNVRKHSATRRAVLRAVRAADRLTVTVLDSGCGFEPDRVPDGLGLRESVIARMAQAGGSVVITSTPGAGTHVEISMSLAPVVP